MPVVIGVAGGTGSGKTTVAQNILASVGAQRIAMLPVDNYYQDVEWENEAQLLNHNFDHPSALDLPLLIEHVSSLKNGQPIAAPVYDFVAHRRKAETRLINPRHVVLMEGILILADRQLRELLDLKIFVDTASDVRLMRRIRRDISERGRSIEDVLRQYEETVRPMHIEFAEPSKRWADIIVPEGGENKVAIEMLSARVQQLV